MKIDYPSRSKFLFTCEETIVKNKEALSKGIPITIPLSEGGYEARITVTIEGTNPYSFQTDWTNPDPSRFPVRIKAAAYVLFRNDCYGVFSISHFSGVITIQPLKQSAEIDSPYKNKTENHVKDRLSIPHIESKSIRTNNTSSIQNQLAETLKMIPWEKWQLIVKNEPEWQQLEPLRDKFPHGSFSVFMLAVGLNAYQLKGRAEITYWPQLYEIMKNFNSEPSVEALYEHLAEFYKTERLNAAKLERLSRFLSSPLAKKLWTMSPQEIASMTVNIWHSLGNVMGQGLHDKTICFAMKCLGISLMMANEYDFDFHDIPIPVDSRITKLTNNLGIDIGEKTKLIQDFWNDILSLLRQALPQINMIHLDSIIWQIAHHDSKELISYFDDFGITNIGKHLSHFLQDNSSTPKQIPSPQIIDSPNILKNNISTNKRILILFPCSDRKNNDLPKETFSKNEEKQVIDSLQNTRPLLTSGRAGLSNCIDVYSSPLPAIDRYDGFLYKSDPDFRIIIKQALSNKNIHALILSGAYGAVTPSERIHDYDQMMKASYWKTHGLPRIIEEYITLNKITHVYGFFSKTTDYMKIMTSIGWIKLKEWCNLQLARAYYIELSSPGGALKIVPHILGKLITSFIQSGFNDADFYENPFHGQYVDFVNFIDLAA